MKKTEEKKTYIHLQDSKTKIRYSAVIGWVLPNILVIWEKRSHLYNCSERINKHNIIYVSVVKSTG